MSGKIGVIIGYTDFTWHVKYVLYMVHVSGDSLALLEDIMHISK